MVHRLLPLVGLVLVAGLCGVAPEAVADDSALAQIEKQIGLVPDGRTVRYVRAVGARLAARADTPKTLRFFVVDMVEPNAFALEGGEVFISRGMLALLNSEDELANVLAHEVGHVMSRHHEKQRARRVPLLPVQIATGIGAAAVGVVSPELGGAVAAVGRAPGALVLSAYSRSQENEADRVGQTLAAETGWDPAAMTATMETLARESVLYGSDPERQSFFATHPTSPERARTTAQTAAGLTRAPAHPIAGSQRAFLGELEGLLVGHSGAEGVFVEQRFLHRDLDFSVEFPAGWRTANGSAVVGAVAPDSKSATILQVVVAGDDPRAGAAQFSEQSGIRLDGVPTALEIGGAPALRARAETGGLLSRTALTLYWIAHGGHVFQFVGSTPRSTRSQMRPRFRASAESFRRLGADERRLITEGRLRLATPVAGELLGELAMRHDTVWSVEQTAVANGLEGDTALDPARPVKLAIREVYTPR